MVCKLEKQSPLISIAYWKGLISGVKISVVVSPTESAILLRREIPMAWGTTIDSLTPEINHFQYAIEIKYLTLKDQTLYLIRTVEVDPL